MKIRLESENLDKYFVYIEYELQMEDYGFHLISTIRL